MLQSRRRFHVSLRAFTIPLALALLVWTFRGLDVTRVANLLARISPAAFVLVLLPQLASLTCETIGWREAFAVLGRKVSILPLLRVRISTEALAQTLPMGVVFCESVKPSLLNSSCGIRTSEALTGMAARKYLLVLSQSFYVFGLSLLGFSTLRTASAYMIGSSGLEWLMLGCGIGLFAAAWLVRSTLSHGAFARRLFDVLLRAPSARLRAALRQRTHAFCDTDTDLRRYFAGPAGGAARPASWFFLGWLFEALETYLLLRLLGVELDFAAVGGLEVALSFVRNVAFMLPSGIGVQDAGYVAFLQALSVPDPLTTGAAFVLLKRSKEMCWAAVGYGLLALQPRPARQLELGVEST